MDKDTEERIVALILMYRGSARNLRKVADLAAEQDFNSVVAYKSRAKADTYDLVIADLENLIERKG
jgi:hypothetical protein